MKLIRNIFILASGFWHLASVHAATVTATNAHSILNLPLNTKITFTPTNSVLISNGGLSAGPAITTNIVNGSFSITLDGGPYIVTLPLIQSRDPFCISVPNDTNSYDIVFLATNLNQIVSTNWTPLISTKVLPGSNILIVTNNAGTPNESVTISSQFSIGYSAQPASGNLTNWSALQTNTFGNYLLVAIYNSAWGNFSTNVLGTFLTSASSNNFSGKLNWGQLDQIPNFMLASFTNNLASKSDLSAGTNASNAHTDLYTNQVTPVTVSNNLNAASISSAINLPTNAIVYVGVGGILRTSQVIGATFTNGVLTVSATPLPNVLVTNGQANINSTNKLATKNLSVTNQIRLQDGSGTDLFMSGDGNGDYTIAGGEVSITSGGNFIQVNGSDNFNNTSAGMGSSLGSFIGIDVDDGTINLTVNGLGLGLHIADTTGIVTFDTPLDGSQVANVASNSLVTVNPRQVYPMTLAGFTNLSANGINNWCITTNLASGGRWTNNSGVGVTYIVSIGNTVAAVNGASDLALMCIAAPSVGGKTNHQAYGTTLGVTIAMTYTNSQSIFVATNAIFVLTNLSSGAGNSASVIDAQIKAP